MDMTNETVGDAYSDMLIVETVLCDRGWNLKDWCNTYKDLPNRLMKVTVKVNIYFFMALILILTYKNKKYIFFRIEVYLLLQMLNEFV